MPTFMCADAARMPYGVCDCDPINGAAVARRVGAAVARRVVESWWCISLHWFVSPRFTSGGGIGSLGDAISYDVIDVSDARGGGVLAGPTDQPRISRSTQVYSQETLWHTRNEAGEQDLYELGQPAESTGILRNTQRRQRWLGTQVQITRPGRDE